MRLGVRQRKRGSPRAAEDMPDRDLQQVAQCFDVADEVHRRIVGNLAVRSRAAGAALIEQDDTVVRRIEKPPVLWRASRSRAAVKEQHGRAVRIAALLPVQGMDVVNRQAPGAIRLDWRIEVGQTLSPARIRSSYQRWNMSTMNSVALSGPGTYSGLAVPRCVSSTKCASWLFVAIHTRVRLSTS
jgi:hypothetical protein